MIEQLIFLIVFYISNESDVKNFLIWFINRCSKEHSLTWLTVKLLRDINN